MGAVKYGKIKMVMINNTYYIQQYIYYQFFCSYDIIVYHEIGAPGNVKDAADDLNLIEKYLNN